MRFFDASAIVKRYVREAGTARVRRLLRDGDVAVSRYTEVEVSSALARLSREGAITPSQRDRALARLAVDLEAWTVVEVTSAVTARARRLLVSHSLRAGDAVQLAAALALQEGLGRIVEEFVAYDERLRVAARGEHFNVHE